MPVWTINIGPVKKIDTAILDARLEEIKKQVRGYRMPSKVAIAAFAKEKRRLHGSEIEALEEIVGSTADEIELASTALRELAEPLLNPPKTGATFHEELEDQSSDIGSHITDASLAPASRTIT